MSDIIEGVLLSRVGRPSESMELRKSVFMSVAVKLIDDRVSIVGAEFITRTDAVLVTVLFAYNAMGFIISRHAKVPAATFHFMELSLFWCSISCTQFELSF